MAKYTPRERKHRRIVRPKNSNTIDANAEIILPVTKLESQSSGKSEKLKKELSTLNNVTGKKRKRLEKYIDTKLKKEENLELLKKLAAQKVDTSLLQSSKKLGRVNETKKERFQRALRERRAGIDVAGDQDNILFERRLEVLEPSKEEENEGEDDGEEEGDDDDDDDDDDGNENEDKKGATLSVEGSPLGPHIAAFGSGLKRPLETDDSGQPIIKRRKRRKANERQHSTEPEISTGSEDDSEDSGDEWNGFDSDLENDIEVSPASSHSDEDGADPDESDDDSTKPARASAFKAWANARRNEAVGFVPSTVGVVGDEAIKAGFQPRLPSPDPDATTVATPDQSGKTYRPSHAVTIQRTDDVQSARSELPVVQEEQRIIEAIHNNPIVVICGATGSGKTTQLPQMLLENGYASKGMIGITQPRRVAATSVAARVSFELGNVYGKQVAHQVRYDSSVGRETTIKFMTDGILLREIGEDFSLNKYSVIVIDEAHERSVNTDILIGMLSRIVPLRFELSQEQPQKYVPLKLVIMSASLRVTDFILNDRLFPDAKPPIIEAEGRQYPVTVHFARKTYRNFVSETVSKVSRGHRKLPPGGILVFLTGEDEIQQVAKELKEQLLKPSLGPQFARPEKPSTSGGHFQGYLEEDDRADSDSDTEIKIDDGGNDGEDSDEEFMVEDDAVHGAQKGPIKPFILPLYASLRSDQQMLVFKPPPEGSRLIILSTNVAETSLTIPGIRYVFDCGRSKEKCYDESTGVQEFVIDFISKASATQRTGRAGRTGPGHCYRLYSSAIYEQYFDDHTVPEIHRTPIEGTVLQLKSMNVEKVINFPFPTPPKLEQLGQAEKLLKNLGAIDRSTGRVSDLGKELVKYPVNPRFGKMLMLGLRNGVLEHVAALVAALAAGNLFIAEPQIRSGQTASDDASSEGDNSDAERHVVQTNLEDVAAVQKQRQAYGRARAELSSQDEQSDAIKMLTAIAVHAQAEVEKRTEDFCAQYFLREKGMSEAQKLRRQLYNITHGQDRAAYSPILPLATSQNLKLLKQIVAAGFIDQVAIRADLLPTSSESQVGRKPRRAIEVAYRTLTPSNHEIDRTADIAEQEKQKNVYVHSSSLLARLSVKEMPSFVVYSHLSRAPISKVGASSSNKIRMHPLVTVGPKQLAALAEGTPLLELGKPIGKVEEISAGKRECWVGVALRDPAHTMSSWPLGTWKVLQTRGKRDWVVERVISRQVAAVDELNAMTSAVNI